MRFFGSMALFAAIIIVGYSATSLFMSAFTASSEPWQQYLAGMGTAAVVAWEAGAVLLIGAAWHRGFKPVAVGASVLLVVAMLVTLVWEARIVIGGRSDKFASREVSVNKLKGIEEDLAWLRERRKTVTKAKDLDWITERIEQREKDRDAAASIREIMPEASTAAQIMGGSEERWRAFITALPLLFWMLARVLAVPLAMMAFARKAEKPQEAPKREEAISAPPTVSRQPAITVEAFVKPIEPEPVSPLPPPTKPSPKEEKAEPVIEAPKYPVLVDENFAKKKSVLPKSIAKWRKSFLIEDTAKLSDGSYRHVVKGSDAWAHYSSLPGLSEVKSQSGFGKKLSKLGVRKESRVDGVYYVGVRLMRQEEAKVA